MTIQPHSEKHIGGFALIGARNSSAFMTNWMMRESRSCCGLRKS